jgi:hypothetical protein
MILNEAKQDTYDNYWTGLSNPVEHDNETF